MRLLEPGLGLHGEPEADPDRLEQPEPLHERDPGAHLGAADPVAGVGERVDVLEQLVGRVDPLLHALERDLEQQRVDRPQPLGDAVARLVDAGRVGERAHERRGHDRIGVGHAEEAQQVRQALAAPHVDLLEPGAEVLERLPLGRHLAQHLDEAVDRGAVLAGGQTREVDELGHRLSTRSEGARVRARRR
ncbi:MAG: hypothetical protein H6703_17240 [Myxococcales bacterium]|nr:hypothetical protein [Myxococcales bacterium]